MAARVVTVHLSDALDATTTVGPHTLSADASVESGGRDHAPQPEELLLSALGSCTAMTLTIYARRKGWALASVSVELESNKDGITRKIRVAGDLPGDQVERLLEIANKCPVHKLVTNPIPVTSSITL